MLLQMISLNECLIGFWLQMYYFFIVNYSEERWKWMQVKALKMNANSHYMRWFFASLYSVCWCFWFMIVKGWDSCCNPMWWKIGGWKIRSTLWACRLLGHNNFMVQRIFLNCSWECLSEAYNMNTAGELGQEE